MYPAPPFASYPPACKLHRRALGIRWRRLSAGRQALLFLVHLRNGHTYAHLAAGFDIGITTVYRYVTEAVEFLGLAGNQHVGLILVLSGSRNLATSSRVRKRAVEAGR
jgi:hypothetical protein